MTFTKNTYLPMYIKKKYNTLLQKRLNTNKINT